MKETGGIAIVGPCASGKSSLARKLQQAGYRARQIAQEHSYVPDMWQTLSQPEVLIFLDASYEICTERKNLSWTTEEYQTQRQRLEHALENNDIYINTDELSEKEVFKKARQLLDGGQSVDPSL